MDDLKDFRDRFGIPLSDDELKTVPYYKPDADSPELKYMMERRNALGGVYPQRRNDFEALEVPALDSFSGQLKESGKRTASTTMALVRILSSLAKDKNIGHRVVPIVPDEARTFGMEGMFRQLGIYTSEGQRYTPHDRDQIMWYKESKTGQILEEGINESGSMSAWIAAATSYSAHNFTLIPFYITYSMFGLQRTMDLAWAAGDSRARGFLIGATAGRTTLNGEGLQHEDGHSLLLANMIPNCVSYDATYAYELAVIIQDGMKRMYQDKENIFYYLTVMNEAYSHPAMPEGAEEGILKGMYLLSEGKKTVKKKVQLLGSGTILREVEAAAEILRSDFGVESDVWSATSFNMLRREGLEIERWNTMHPEETPRKSYVETCLEGRKGPVIASTDYIKSYASQIRDFVPAETYRVLGTDGFGRSDTRSKLRGFFEVDRYYVVVAALKALADEGTIKPQEVTKAIKKFNLDPEKPSPMSV